MQLLLNIDVPDLQAAVAFYSQAFGWQPRRWLFAGEVVELQAPQLSIYLLAQPAGGTAFAGDTEGRRYQRHWTPLHLDLLVEDLESALDQALSAGARLEGEIRHTAWSRLARLSDPFGHGFCLMQWQGRGYDEVAEP
ncbi:MAG: VOC family protein [Pseudomonadota bacterium]